MTTYRAAPAPTEEQHVSARDNIIDLIHSTIEDYITDVGGDPADVDTLDLAENIMLTLINKSIITGVS